MNVFCLFGFKRFAPRFCLVAFFSAAASAAAAESVSAKAEVAPASTKERTKDFLHDLLPVAWQKRPQQRFNAFTEMTEEGKKRRIPTPEQPMYYYSPPPQFAQLGLPPGGEKPPPLAELEAAMRKALAANGYLPIADDRQRPDVLIILAFGSSTRGEPDDETRQEALMHYIERARLVGGDRFASDLLKAIREAAVFGVPPPVTMFVKTFDSEVVERSVDIAGDNLYFATATAFDFAGVEKKQPLSLWQTRMALESQGVSMEEALSPLILNAGAALGRETPEPRLVKKRLDREGHVDLGTPTVIGESKPATSSPPPTPVSDGK